MIISHRHRFIFVKTYKTAGTSLETYLSDHCGPDDVLTPLKPPEPGHRPRNYQGLWNPIREIGAGSWRSRLRTLWELARQRRFRPHMSARQIRDRVSSGLWNGYFKFCVERNPWDKSVSHFHMQRHKGRKGMTFQDYLQAGKFCLNYPLYLDDRGGLLVNRVLRFERLDAELAEVFRDLGIPFPGNLGVRAKGNIRPASSNYQDCYTAGMAATIAAAFKTEIELHGYGFDSGTRLPDDRSKSLHQHGSGALVEPAD